MSAPKVTPETTDDLSDTELALYAIRIDLGRDTHLERCDLAKRGGPDATLACAECGRAQWMHRTRHDTCGRFCYVTVYTITSEMLQVLRFLPTVSHEVRVACARALNEFGDHNEVTVRDAKRICAAWFSSERQRICDAINARKGR